MSSQSLQFSKYYRQRSYKKKHILKTQKILNVTTEKFWGDANALFPENEAKALSNQNKLGFQENSLRSIPHDPSNINLVFAL